MANRINIWNINHNSIKKCLICGKEFRVKWSHLERRKCCSKECRYKLQSQLLKGNKYRGNGIKRICKTCKKEFITSPSMNKKYCSMKCYNRKQNKNVNWKGGLPRCISCNKIISRKSLRCKKCANKLIYNPNWQGGKSFELYPFNFNKELKELIRRRDNYKCKKCGKAQIELKRKLHIHHKDFNKQNCNPNNLISLCNSCHNKL